MATLHSQDYRLQIKQGTRANLEKVTNYFLQGELIYTTDGKQLFIADGSYIPQPVASLDMAVVNDTGDIITNGGEIVWLY